MAIAFFIVLIFVIIPLLIISSTLKININEFELINKKINKFQVIVSLVLFSKWSWLKLRIDNDRVNRIDKKIKKQIFNKLLNSRILTRVKSFDGRLIKEWKQIFEKMNLEEANFNLKIGTEDACFTAYTIGIISSVAGIFLSRRVKKAKYLIEPIYIDKNYIYLSLNCILAIKLVQIINRKKVVREKEVYRNYGISSNRRANVNSHG